ncbi:hypothetical protein Q7P37_003145 [Cladosporium fusiforme]
MIRRVNVALVIVATLCVLIRFVARWRISGNTIGWDDWTILVSWILVIPSSTILQLMINTGLGRDIWTVPFDNITLMFKYFYINQYIYQAIIALTKISIVLLYLRIFPKTVSKRFSYISWVLIGALIGYGRIQHVCPLLEALFRSPEIHPSLLAGCSVTNQYYGRVFDLIVFFLPIPKLMAIQVQDKRRKAGVVLTFLIGLFVTACSMVRLKYLSQVSMITNATYDYTEITLWSAIESDVGIICACLPTIIGPMLNFFRNKLGSKLSSFSKSSTNKSATTSFHVPGDKTVTRIPSSVGTHDLEMDDRTPRHGGIEKTMETSIYHHTAYQQSSDDDTKLLRLDR